MRATPIAVLLFTCLVLLPGLGRMRAADSTDARYLEISRAMLESGDWLVPRIAGEPHLDKPPFTYWASGLGYLALGVNPFAGRLAAQLSLIATALLVALAGRRLCGASGAALAAVVMVTSGLFFTSSRGLSTDPHQLLLFTAAMFAFLRGVEDRGRPAFVALAFLLLGLSMNVKGPIALFVAVLVWLPFLLLTRGRTRLSGRAVALGLGLFVLVGAPWYLALWSNDPHVMRYFLETQLLGRVTGATRGVHVHPFYYEFVTWPLGLLPWTPLVALALWRLRPREGVRNADPVDLYLLLWSFVPVLFFSIPRSKLPTYLLVGFPAASLGLARALEKGRLGDRVGRWALVACGWIGAIASLGLAVALLHPHWIESSRLDFDQLHGAGAFSAALTVVAGTFAALTLRVRRQGRVDTRRLAALAVATGLLFTVGFGAIGPTLGSNREEGLIARSVPNAWLLQAGLDRLSALYYFGNLERFRFASLPSRSRPKRAPNPYWEQEIPGEEVITRLQSDEPVFCLTKERNADELVAPTGAVVVHRGQGTVLLANRAAHEALAPADTVRGRQSSAFPLSRPPAGSMTSASSPLR